MKRLLKWVKPNRKSLEIEIDKSILEDLPENEVRKLRDACKAEATKLIDEFFDD